MPVGVVETGIVKPGIHEMFGPLEIVAEIKSVEQHHENLPQAAPGDNVGYDVKNVVVKDLKRGFVASDSKSDPAQSISSFEAQSTRQNFNK